MANLEELLSKLGRNDIGIVKDLFVKVLDGYISEKNDINKTKDSTQLTNSTKTGEMKSYDYDRHYDKKHNRSVSTHSSVNNHSPTERRSKQINSAIVVKNGRSFKSGDRDRDSKSYGYGNSSPPKIKFDNTSLQRFPNNNHGYSDNGRDYDSERNFSNKRKLDQYSDEKGRSSNYTKRQKIEDSKYYKNEGTNKNLSESIQSSPPLLLPHPPSFGYRNTRDRQPRYNYNSSYYDNIDKINGKMVFNSRFDGSYNSSYSSKSYRSSSSYYPKYQPNSYSKFRQSSYDSRNKRLRHSGSESSEIKSRHDDNDKKNKNISSRSPPSSLSVKPGSLLNSDQYNKHEEKVIITNSEYTNDKSSDGEFQKTTISNPNNMEEEECSYDEEVFEVNDNDWVMQDSNSENNETTLIDNGHKKEEEEEERNEKQPKDGENEVVTTVSCNTDKTTSCDNTSNNIQNDIKKNQEGNTKKLEITTKKEFKCVEDIEKWLLMKYRNNTNNLDDNIGDVLVDFNLLLLDI